MLDGNGHAARMDESECEIVQRERFCAPVTEVAHDRQRGAVLLGSLFVLAVTPKLGSELVESPRSRARVDCGRLLLLRTQLEGVPGLLRGVRRQAPKALPGVELIER